MEIFGGFFTMISILGFFLTVIWFVLPFVVFGIKGKTDRSVELLESLEQRMTRIESKLERLAARSELTPADDPTEYKSTPPDYQTSGAVQP